MPNHPVSINCTEVGPLCSVEDTIYGYRPNLGLNAFFIALFSLIVLINILFTIRYKTWFYGIALILGCIGEAIGYCGRVIMHSNPYDDTGFSIQISCLIFSPAFVAASIYLTLKHIVLNTAPSESRLPAYLYTWVFIACDFVSLLLQAIGGGIASSANGDMKQLDLGTNLMIAGIVWQVATLLCFSGLVLDFVLSLRKNWCTIPASGKALVGRKSFIAFAWGVGIAFAAVMLRCIYRIAEMAQGWANPIMRDEPSFAIMEGFMIVIAVIALTVFHPGYCFPQLAKQNQNAMNFVEKGLQNKRNKNAEATEVEGISSSGD